MLIHSNLRRRMTRPAAVALVLSALSSSALPLAVSAAEEPSWRTEFGPAYSRFDYREFDEAGRRLDSETGHLPGITAAIAHSWDAWEARLAGDWYGEAIDYDGFAFNPTTGLQRPLATTTRETITSVEGTLLRWLEGTDRGIAVYGGIGLRVWQRDIHANAAASSTSALETYRFGYAILGLRAKIYRAAQFEWAIDGRLTRTLSPSLAIDFSGAFDSAQLQPAPKTAWRVALPLDVQLKPKDTLRFEPYYTTWSLGRSQIESLTRHRVQLGFGIFEPRSETTSSGLSISWLHAF